MVSAVLHSRARETDPQQVQCTNGYFNAQFSDTGAKKSQHLYLLSFAFVWRVPSSREALLASLSISYLMYKAQCLWEILSDLPGWNELLYSLSSHRDKVQTPGTCFYHLSTIAFSSLHIWLSKKPQTTRSSDASFSGSVCPCTLGHNLADRLWDGSPLSQT